MNRILKNLAGCLISPRLHDEDGRRRELALNILLFFSIAGFIAINIIRIADRVTHPHDRGLPIAYTVAILLFFGALLLLSRRGWVKTASWFLLATYSLPMFYSFIAWGSDLPAALLLAVLIITLSGILIGANLVLASTIIINIFLIGLTYAQSRGLIAVNRYWLAEKYELSDAVAHAVLFLIIASIAWLFALEINRALKRARESEAALRQERDSLEIKVAERTEQLRQAEAEKIGQLYRLAEFGRLSSGIFHDLISPLTAVSLNLGQIEDGTSGAGVLDVRSYLHHALLATRKMEGLIAGIKKQIQQESDARIFTANEEIKQIIQILAYKARQAKTPVEFTAAEEVHLYGDPVKFGQIITNLLANAIEATEEALENNRNRGVPSKIKKIRIDLSLSGQKARIDVSDEGAGIAPENINKIFEAFFSTKKESGRGLGLGLSSTKNIIEKNFQGQIEVMSELKRGSRFTVTIPLPSQANEKN